MLSVYKFKLNTVKLVEDFTKLASSIDGDITISSGRYIVNGKSIMGIFSLDLTKELTCELTALDEDKGKFEDGLKNLNLI